MKGRVLLLISVLALVVSIAGCLFTSPSYTRTNNGDITAVDGTYTMLFGPDGKTIVGESFTPTNSSGNGGTALLWQLVQSLLNGQMQMKAPVK